MICTLHYEHLKYFGFLRLLQCFFVIFLICFFFSDEQLFKYTCLPIFNLLQSTSLIQIKSRFNHLVSFCFIVILAYHNMSIINFVNSAHFLHPVFYRLKCLKVHKIQNQDFEQVTIPMLVFIKVCN